MGILALIVINKAGGLIYNRNFGDGLNQLTTNDYLVLAGTFHGVHAITTRLNPLKSIQQQQQATMNGAGGIPSRPDAPSGLEVLESENFRLQCFNTLTGTKFLLFTDTLQANVDVAMRKVYDLYADYVTKNPFYQLEMPIRCDTFDRKLNSYIREMNNAR
ncbi:Sybindin-like protein [Xylaria nigripes]|nr:Sybindin-like protein [Xylaria nigripes]